MSIEDDVERRREEQRVEHDGIRQTGRAVEIERYIDAILGVSHRERACDVQQWLRDGRVVDHVAKDVDLAPIAHGLEDTEHDAVRRKERHDHQQRRNISDDLPNIITITLPP